MDRIWFDADEVFHDFLGVFYRHILAHHGFDCQATGSPVYYANLLPGSPLSLQQALDMVDVTYDSEEYWEQSPLKGSSGPLQRARALAPLGVVTARTSRIRDRTERWLEQHLPGLFDLVVCVSVDSRPDYLGRKVDVIAQHGAIALVEDSASNLRGARAAGIKGVLLDRPWNAAAGDSADYVRVPHLTAAVDVLERHHATLLAA